MFACEGALAQADAHGQPPQAPAGIAAAEPQMPKLGAGAQEVATELEIMPLLDRLYRLPEKDRCGSSATLEALMLRQEISDRVLTASLEIDGVFAEVDNEIGQLNAVRNDLEDRRDRALKINSIAGIVTGGALGVVSTALQFKDSTTQAGNVIGVMAGAVSTVLSAVGIRQQRGGREAIGSRTNMLAKLFDRPLKEHSDYPAEVWLYLKAKPPTEDGPEDRIDRLKSEWMKSGRIDADTVKAKKKIDLFTDNSDSPRKMTIDLLSDRAAMLGDVRLRVSFMKRDLSKLLLAVRCHQ
jgi:hypothetical protein